jgi:hypothetical protein
MEKIGVIGQEIVFDDNGEENTGVIKDIHETTGNYIVLADDGRTVLADKELDVISLGKMRAKPAEAKKRFGFFEDGGNLDSMTLNQLLDKVPIFERMHIDGYADYTRSKSAFDDLVEKFGNRRYSEEQSRQYDNFKKRKVMYENSYKQNVIKYLQSRKMEDGGEVSFSSKAVEKASLEELFDMAKELKMENFHNMNKEMLRRKILDHFKLNRYRKYEDGGNIEKETNEMLLSQIKEVKHHADELSNVVNKNTTIEPWVLAKATRAKTDLSDITHYLDGRKMVRGGKLTDAQQEKFNKVLHEWKAGRLHSGSKNGPIVTDQDQALAIAYSQANSMMAFGGMIDDNLSEDSIDRMEGLAPTATLDEFVMNTQYIVKSLEEEGFEKDEILSFLAYTMVSTIKEAQSSNETWTQQDQNALEGWISDIQDGYGWITPGYVETSWTSRPGSGTKEWTSDIQRRVYQALIDENMLFRANENDPEKKGRKVKDLTTAMWAASEEMSNRGGIDSQYWADYNDAPGPKYMSEKSKTFDTTFAKAVKEWNDMNDDEETLSKKNVERSRKVAKQFFDKEGYITINIVMAMISQESFSEGGGVEDNWVYWKIEKKVNGDDVVMYERTHSSSPIIPKAVEISKREYDENKFANGGGVDTMSTVNKISRISGLRTVAIREWAEKNNINLEAILKDLKAKKITGMDLMTAIVGKPGNTYSKEFISKYSKMSTGGAMSGWKHKGNK